VRALSEKRRAHLTQVAEAVALNWFLMVLNPRARGPAWAGRVWSGPEAVESVTSFAVGVYGTSCTFPTTPATDRVVRDAAARHWRHLVEESGLAGQVVSAAPTAVREPDPWYRHVVSEAGGCPVQIRSAPHRVVSPCPFCVPADAVRAAVDGYRKAVILACGARRPNLSMRLSAWRDEVAAMQAAEDEELAALLRFLGMQTASES
jgi:hypothetical protein